MVERQALAFKHEFYEGATRKQITDDVVSYLGEYRFQVPEFNYTMGLKNGRLTDPNSGEQMILKAKKAIDTRRIEGLNTSREEAEFEGLLNIEKQLREKSGTLVWFSPPGNEKDGYGPYGFGYTGRVKGDVVEMTAIRVENPQIGDFNRASQALWGKRYERAEDFLSSPQVIDIEPNRVKDFIHGNFEIKDNKGKEIFRRALRRLDGVINEYVHIVKRGTSEQKRKALYALENITLEVKKNLESSLDTNVIYFSDYMHPNLAAAMATKKYTSEPPKVLGSCGTTGRVESNDIFSNLNLFKDSARSILNNNSKDETEWFTCPKCSYKADGPIGNTCPGCGLTKDGYAQESGEPVCD